MGHGSPRRMREANALRNLDQCEMWNCCADENGCWMGHFSSEMFGL